MFNMDLVVPAWRRHKDIWILRPCERNRRGRLHVKLRLSFPTGRIHVGYQLNVRAHLRFGEDDLLLRLLQS